ncbi:MAG TPA: ATP-binding protein [Solirubrobacteraceae bacterium]
MNGRPAFHPSLRLKLSVAFAGAMAVLLTGLGLFIYHRFQGGLDSSLNQSLRSRATDVRVLNAQADTALADSRQLLGDRRNVQFAQVLRPDGTLLDATPGVARLPLLSVSERQEASHRSMVVDRETFPGGPARLFVTPALSQDHQPVLVVVGASLRDRQAALHDLSAVMLLGGPVALLLASLLGYAVAAFSLRSVEALRNRASALSVTEPGARLPVPAAKDELRRLALTLNQMLERNEAAFARERRFVADASHELRTPLSVLKAELEVALTGESSARELRAALASADAEADRVIRLAQDLLALAQADHGILPLELDEVSVDDLLERVAERFAPRARAQNRMVVARIGDDRTIRADPVYLEQALSNLVDNALRHGGGEVTLRATFHGAALELHVEDEGPGFPEGFLALAFDRFSRAEGSRTREGTGLGLAIVRSIADAHGAGVQAANRSGRGADVWLTLPVHTRPAEPSPHAPVGPAHAPPAPVDGSEVPV